MSNSVDSIVFGSLVNVGLDSVETKEASFYVNSIITNWNLNQLTI